MALQKYPENRGKLADILHMSKFFNGFSSDRDEHLQDETDLTCLEILQTFVNEMQN